MQPVTDDTRDDASETAALYAQADPETRAQTPEALTFIQRQQEKATGEAAMREQFIEDMASLPPARRRQVIALTKTVEGIATPADRADAASLLRELRARNRALASHLWVTIHQCRREVRGQTPRGEETA